MFKTYRNAFQIGFVAGMRSLSAPAIVSHKLSTAQPDPIPTSKLHFFTSLKAANALMVLAGAELVGDKVPNVPNRIETQPLTMRIASGAACGAAISEAEGKQARFGAVFGGLGAIAGAYTFFYLRRWLTFEKGLPDPYVAIAEDVLAIGAGLLTVNSLELEKQVA